MGLVDPSNSASKKALSNLIFTDISSAQDLLEQPNYLSHIDLILDQDGDRALIEADLPPGIVLDIAEAEKNAVKQMTAAFKLNLQALSLLALVVGMFLIYNTVTFSVVQRRSLFGILRCLGVTPGQLFQTIMGEAAILSVIGSAIGVGLGVVLGRAVVGLITQTINDFLLCGVGSTGDIIEFFIAERLCHWDCRCSTSSSYSSLGSHANRTQHIATTIHPRKPYHRSTAMAGSWLGGGNSDGRGVLTI